VLRGIAAGKVYGEIGNELGLSVSTVRTHAQNSVKKVGVPDRAQAVLTAAARGWI
jgi:DNA-binding NarL/FixJ family response regulator